MNNRGQVSGNRVIRRRRALDHAVRLTLQPLETRVLMSGALYYVNDNWNVTTDVGPAGLSANDIVANTGDDGSLHGLTYGVNAFSTITGALGVAGAGDRVVVVSGSYTEDITVTAGVSLEGWSYFAVAAGSPNANPDAAHITQGSLNAALKTQVSGAQWTINDALAQSVSIRGFWFSNLLNTGTVHATATNHASVTVRDNTFTDNSPSAIGILVDAASSATAVDLSNNSFIGTFAPIKATSVSGSISGNTVTVARKAIYVAEGQSLSISNNTISQMTTGVDPGQGIQVDAPLAGVSITGNHITLDQDISGILVSNAGTQSVTVSGNIIDNAVFRGFAGIYVTGSGATGGATNAVVTGNQISGVEFGVAATLGGTASVSGNQLSALNNGVYVSAGSTASITGNTITGASIGVDIEPTAGGLISGNSIHDSTVGVLYNSTGAGTITAMHFEGGAVNHTDLEIDQADNLVFGGGDHFRADTAYVVNASSTDITLPWEDFGTSDAAAIDAGIQEIPGTVNWVLSDFYVNAGSSIQSAVNAALSGAIIHISTGHFMEQVTVASKNLTLTGAGQGQTFIDSPDTLALSFVTSADNKAVVTFSDVASGNIDNLTIDGRSAGSTNARFIGLAYRNAGGLVDHVTVSNVGDNPLSSVQAGVGIYAYANNGTARALTVQNSMVNNYQKAGINLSGANLTATVNQNVVTGVGLTGTIAQNGIQVGYGAAGIISNNTVSGNEYTNLDSEGAGILLFNAAGGITVSGNNLQLNDAGIATNVAANITGNLIADNLDGIQLLNNQAGTTITQNDIRDNVYRGILVDLTVTGAIAIHNNSLTGNLLAALENDALVTLDASSNWWGDIKGPATTLNTYDTTPSSTSGGTVSGNATIVAWLSSGVDGSAAIGFQPTVAPDGTVPTLAVSDQMAGANFSSPVNLGTITDALTTTGLWHVVVNWGDGSALTSFYSASNTPVQSHTYDLAHTGSQTVTVSVTDGSGNATSNSFTVNVVQLNNTVTDQHLFYKGSAFDTGSHDDAIATDKLALFDGGSATLANYSSYDKGINGLMVDINGPVSLTAADFSFATGNSGDSWTPLGALPAINVRDVGGGVNRVEITFADGLIKGTWLQVTVHAGAYTGLASDYVFYFGNAVGEAGNSATSARVDAIDELTARADMEAHGAATPVAIDNHYDFNRDGFVNSTDLAIARANATWFLNELHLIAPPTAFVPLFLNSVPAGPTSPPQTLVSTTSATNVTPRGASIQPLLDSEPATEGAVEAVTSPLGSASLPSATPAGPTSSGIVSDSESQPPGLTSTVKTVTVQTPVTKKNVAGKFVKSVTGSVRTAARHTRDLLRKITSSLHRR